MEPATSGIRRRIPGPGRRRGRVRGRLQPRTAGRVGVVGAAVLLHLHTHTYIHDYAVTFPRHCYRPISSESQSCAFSTSHLLVLFSRQKHESDSRQTLGNLRDSCHARMRRAASANLRDLSYFLELSCGVLVALGYT